MMLQGFSFLINYPKEYTICILFFYALSLTLTRITIVSLFFPCFVCSSYLITFLASCNRCSCVRSQRSSRSESCEGWSLHPKWKEIHCKVIHVKEMHTDTKKIYIAPASTVVTLFADEDVMLALSGTKADGTEALSNGKEGWNNTEWDSTDDEE